MGWIGTIVFGIVIGALARLVLPGDQHMPVWMHIIIGVAGALIGYWIAGMLGIGETGGIDVLRWVISILVAAGLIVVVDRLMPAART